MAWHGMVFQLVELHMHSKPGYVTYRRSIKEMRIETQKDETRKHSTQKSFFIIRPIVVSLDSSLWKITLHGPQQVLGAHFHSQTQFIYSHALKLLSTILIFKLITHLQ